MDVHQSHNDLLIRRHRLFVLTSGGYGLTKPEFELLDSEGDGAFVHTYHDLISLQGCFFKRPAAAGSLVRQIQTIDRYISNRQTEDERDSRVCGITFADISSVYIQAVSRFHRHLEKLTGGHR